MDSNVTRRILLETMVALACSPMTTSAAASAATPRTPVFQSDLPDLSLKNWSVTAVEVAYGPGESTPAHRHPGLTLVYVLEGAIRSKVGDGPETTYTAGQMFIETPGQLHAVSGNGSATQPARLLAILLAEKGAELTTLAK